MARKECKGTELSVFKGREARLNRAILLAINRESPLLIYGIAKTVRKQRKLEHIKYTNINRRVKALQKQGYIEEAGSRKTQAGTRATLYQPTTRAYLAFILAQIDPT